MEKVPLVLSLLENPQLCLDEETIYKKNYLFISQKKHKNKEALFEKCPSLFFGEKFDLIELGHDLGVKELLAKAMYPMGPFETIVKAQNDTFCSLPTFKVRDKPFYVEPKAMKALRKQRLVENMILEYQESDLMARTHTQEGDVNGLVDGLLER